MSGIVKQRATAPNGPAPQTSDNLSAHKKEVSQNGNTATSSTLTYPSDVSDDVNMNEVNGLVSLDVTLPSGQRADISVDYNTPMLDLLVCLAGKSKLNPAGLALVLVSEDTGKPMSFKPNQTIGALGGRVVRIVTKETVSGKTTNKEFKNDKPFEVTYRFTVNFPRGQKTVVRVSPTMTLGDLVITVCKDKGLDLDLHKYTLQIPGKPGVPVDLNATIQQVGVHEMNLVTVSVQDRNHTVSMPDLSRPQAAGEQPHSNTPLTGEQKRKKGLLSFLGKKNKKNKSDVRQSLEYTSTTNLQMSTPQTSRPTTPPPVPHKSQHEIDQQMIRPKSMFVSSSTSIEDSKPQGQNVQSMVAPARKKRRAPAPPVPTVQASVRQMSSSSETSIPSGKADKENTSAEHLHNKIVSAPTTSQEAEVGATAASIVPQQQMPRTEMLSHIHSRNSSDSSGYHELTLSGCESPEANHVSVGKYKTSIDTASIESSDNAKMDSGIHESPSRVSPIVEMQELAEVASKSVAPVSSSQSVAGGADTLTSRKKRKAPAPPASDSSSKTITDEATSAEVNKNFISTAEITSSKMNKTIISTADVASAELKNNAVSTSEAASAEMTNNTTISATVITQELAEDSTISAQTHSVETTYVPEPQKAALVFSHETESQTYESSVNPPEPVADNESNTKEIEKTSGHFVDDSMDINESTAFDINDILEGVVFDDEPQSIDLIFAGRSETHGRDKDPAMMMETSSVISENIEQVDIDISSHTDRPCAFIPPPPPLEPPPAEQPVVDLESVSSKTDRIFVDKSTGISYDNSSLAPSSVLNSPDTVHKRKGSYTSLGSIDTIESISLDFQQAIQLGEEAISFNISDMEASFGYKSEMALFVERMSKIAMESAEKTKNEPHDDSISTMSIPFSDSNSETGSVIRYLRTDSKDSNSEAGSLTRKEGQKLKSADLQTLRDFQEHSTESFALSEEITEPTMTLPPPPEFDDKDDNLEDKSEESDSTETVEELIIPSIPLEHSDVTSTQKTLDAVKRTEQVAEIPKEKEKRGSISTFKIQPLTSAPVTSAPSSIYQIISSSRFSSGAPTSINKSQTKTKEPQYQPSPAKKEEIVLTIEDLSKVSFLPPKPKLSKQFSQTQPYVQTQPYGRVSSASLVMAKHGHPVASSSKKIESSISEKLQDKDSQSLLPSKTEGHNSVIEDKSKTLPGILTARPTIHTNSIPEVSNNNQVDISIDPLLTKSRPRLVMNSSSSFSRRSTIDHTEVASHRSSDSTHRRSSDASEATSIAVAKVEQPTSSASVDNRTNTQERHDSLQSQYQLLQNQFSQWQEQLARNQNVLTSQNIEPELQTKQLQQLTDQMAIQQKMMEQLQSTMLALQQQQHQPQQPQQNEQVPDRAPVHRISGVHPPKDQAASVSSKSAVKSENTTAKQKPKSRFEPVLDPREQMLTAIRQFAKDGLKSTSVEKTNLVHSNR